MGLHDRERALIRQPGENIAWLAFQRLADFCQRIEADTFLYSEIIRSIRMLKFGVVSSTTFGIYTQKMVGKS